MVENKLSSGVQELIDQLHQEGIAKGRNEAEELLGRARKQAKEIVEDAQREARHIVKKAKGEADQYRSSAEEAMKIAARDMVLDLKGRLTRQFTRRMSDFVEEALVEEDFIKKVILEIVHGSMKDRERQGNMEILLPEKVVGLSELRSRPEKVKEGSLGQFVLSIAKDMVEEGVKIDNHDRDGSSIFIHLVEDEVRIDITEEAISELLARHLLPRFRALLEGSIQ